MNKAAIKNYAIWARIQLIDAAKQRAYEYEIIKNGENKPGLEVIGGKPLTKSEAQQRDQLISQIRQKGYEQVMEEAAYTWFNRFIALRFMEVNGYLPSQTRIFTDENGAFKPEILKEAMTVELDGLDREKVLDLLDKRDDEVLYKYLFITQCNALSKPLPRMFERIADWTELLFPANLLRADSVLGRMISDIPEEDWEDQVQIIGWLYQYYIAEVKDETFALLKKNVKITKERIPAATQLFTPDWIVRYMVENSLGRLWIEGHPDDTLKASWQYYLEEAEQEPEVAARLAEMREAQAQLRPEEIKLIDPCMGSGHILVYAFDVLMQIYLSQGWSERDAAQSIVENNLYGLDIDERAAQLAYFSVMMKARKHDRRFLNRNIQPQVYCTKGDDEGPEYGSLLIVQDPGPRPEQQDLFGGSEDAWNYRRLLSGKYDVVVTNPPYMGGSNMNSKLSEFTKKYFPNEKSDMFACFINRGFQLLKPNGFNCMVTMQSWMFLSSFEKMRKDIIAYNTITNLMHMENMVMGIAFGTAVTVFRMSHINGYKGTYNHIQLKDIREDEPIEFPVSGNRFAQVSADNFSKIPGSPVAYWVSENILKIFEYNTHISNFCRPLQGTISGDNERFLRFWSEISVDKSALFQPAHNAKWFFHSKGGDFRKWYGNCTYVLNWENEGEEIRNFKDVNGKLRSRPQNTNAFFKCGITYSDLTSGKYSARFVTKGATFDATGPTMPFDSLTFLPYVLGYINSVVFQELLTITCPGLHYNNGVIATLPIIYIDGKSREIDQTVRKNICISKEDWNSYETSWDFKKHPMV